MMAYSPPRHVIDGPATCRETRRSSGNTSAPAVCLLNPSWRLDWLLLRVHLSWLALATAAERCLISCYPFVGLSGEAVRCGPSPQRAHLLLPDPLHKPLPLLWRAKVTLPPPPAAAAEICQQTSESF